MKKKRKHIDVRSRVDVVEKALSEGSNLEKAERIALARAILKRLDERAHAARRSTVRKIEREST